MRVMTVIGELSIGGAETTALRLAGGLVERGHEVYTVALRNRGELGDEYLRMGVKLHSRVLKFRYDFLSAWRIAKIIRRKNIDAVIMIDALKNVMCFTSWGIKLSGRNVRKLLWSNSVPTGQMGDFTPRLKKFLDTGQLDEVVCTSEAQKRSFAERGVDADKIRVIFNGVDIERFSGATPGNIPQLRGRPAVLQVANVMPDKDFETLFAAADILNSQGVSFCLLLAGRDTNSTAMRNRIRELGLDDVVVPLGLRCDIPQILAAADVFVISSHSEVFNVATLEAMAAGVAVITSDLPGFDEMFDPSQGMKVPPKNPQALADGIKRLLEDKQLRIRQISAAKTRVERFSVAKMCDDFAAILEAVLSC
ncbi:MAG: glycosyltransferase [Phycisphaerae bacterium]|nr:glycosyltransferase [Phycisphaerae bacterium]